MHGQKNIKLLLHLFT